MTTGIDQTIAERHAGYTRALGLLTLERWEHQACISSLDERIRMLRGLAEEGRAVVKDITVLKEVVRAETMAEVQAEQETEAGGRDVTEQQPYTPSPVVPIEQVRRAKKQTSKTPKKG